MRTPPATSQPVADAEMATRGTYCCSSRRALIVCRWALFGVLAFICSATNAWAAPEFHAALEYEIEPTLKGCPSEGEFRRGVSQQLRYDPFRADAARRILAYAKATQRGIEGGIQWQDASGEHQGERQLALLSQDCAELVRSLAFAVVVQIQLLGSAALSATTPPPEAPRSDPGEPSAESNLPRDDGVDANSGSTMMPDAWWVTAGLGASAAAGLSPELSGLGRLFGAVHYDRWSLELGVDASWPSTLRLADGSGFRSRLLLATLAPCAQFGRFSGCAMAKLGQLRVQGFGVDELRTPTGLFGQVGVRVGASQTLGPVSASLYTAALGTLQRWSVHLDQTDVWTTPPASFQVGIDVAVPFGL